MVAALLETPRPERLYVGLSLLVSAAAEGRPARGLAFFGALELLLDPGLAARVPEGHERLGRTLAELRDSASELDDLHLWACAGAMEAMGLERSALVAPIEGTLSTPRFLAQVQGADLVVV